MRINGTGWYRRIREKGPAYPLTCASCGEYVAFQLVLARYWLSFLWVPFLPVSRQSGYLYCENCEATSEIDSEEVARAKKATKLTTPFLQRAIDSEEYWAEMDALYEQSDFVELPSPEERERPEVEDAPPTRGYQ